jgi:hypothetical protein
MADADYTATCPHFTLGRFLGLAQIANQPELWRVPAEQIVARLVAIAAQYEAAREETPHPPEGFSLFVEQQLAGGE